MRAFRINDFGPPEAMRMTDLPEPVPAPDQVLVRVRATSVNDWDWAMVQGRPLTYRPILGLRKPRIRIPGTEVAGEVRAVGREVRGFRPGDRVYGDISEAGFGAFAEFVSVRHDALRPMPASMSFVDAAAIPHAACLAHQGLVDLGGLRDGMRILINGAGGGVGTLGVQLAKRCDVEVTGVDSGSKLDLMREFGFDEVLDYREVDFANAGRRYDLILDTKSTRGPGAVSKALARSGVYVTVGGEMSRILQIVARGAFSRGGGKRLRLLALKPNKDLDAIGALYEAGGLRCAIDGPHRFETLPTMIRRFGEARHLGKIVITVE